MGTLKNVCKVFPLNFSTEHPLRTDLKMQHTDKMLATNPT